MNKRVGAVLVAGIAIFFVGFLLVFINRSRADNERLSCMNNIREQGMFAAEMAMLADQQKQEKLPVSIPGEIPAGTIVREGVFPEDRLSWIAASLPYLNQKRQNTVTLWEALDTKAVWNVEPNLGIGQNRLVTFICPGQSFEDNTPRFHTDYVGIAGVGLDAAGLSVWPTIPPQAGCFRYDSPTPLQLIYENDGASNTILFAETAWQNGPWIRGGPSTIRGLVIGEKAPKFIGANGQFGGRHPGVTTVGFADGSGRFISDRISPEVFQSMMTFAGQGFDPLPGE